MGARDKKQENRYKFQTFSERIAEISANVAQRVNLPRNETPEEADTFFYEELQKWADLNLTQHYTDFQLELGPDVQSFAQLLYRKDEIIALIQRHLDVEGSLALQPLLSLVGALARDLGADLGPAFPDFFAILCRLLHTKDPEQIQWVFTCLAHLYKLLWRHLTADMEATYRMYRQLLSDGQPQHVVRFAAESFAFVCRKVKDKQKFFTFVHEKLAEDSSQVDGVGRLIFETMRGVRGQLHLDAAAVLRVQLRLLGGGGRLAAPLSQQAIKVALLAAARHVTADHAAPLWTELWWAVSECGAADADLLSRLMDLLLCLLRHRRGALLPDEAAGAAAAAHCADIWRTTLATDQLAAAAADFSAALLTAPQAKLSRENRSTVVSAVLKSGQPASVVLRVMGQLFTMDAFDSHILPEVLAFVYRLPAEAAPQALALLARLVLEKAPPPQTPDLWHQWSCYPLDFNLVMHKHSARRSGRLSKSTGSAPLGLLTSLLLSAAAEAQGESFRHALLVAPHVRPLQQPDIGAALWKKWRQLVRQIDEETSDESDNAARDPVSNICISVPPLPSSLDTRLSLLSLTTEAALRLDSSAEAVSGCWDMALALCTKTILARSSHLLRVLGLLITATEVDTNDQLLVKMYHLLGHNLASPQHKLRLLTLYLLSRVSPTLPPPPPPPAAAPASVFVSCWRAECCAPDIAGYQERLRHLQLLQAEYVRHALPTAADCSLAPLLFVVGQLHVSFRLLWKPSQELLVGLSQTVSADQLARLWRRLMAEAAAAVRKTEHKDGGESAAEAAPDGEGLEGGQMALTSARLAECESRLFALDDRLDDANFRLLLWDVTAQLCPSLEEQCGADIIDQLFQFLEREFFSSDMSFARHQNLLDSKAKTEGAAARALDRQGAAAEDLDDSEVHDEDEEDEAEPKKNKQGEKKKGIVHSLVAHLSVLAQMTSLRRSPRARQLWETFLHFLTHKRTDVQRAALSCVYAYKSKALHNYREALFRLLEDANFKTRLTDLSVDTENGLVKLEHRPHVLPIITRMLYGRMRTSTGKGAASRDGGAARRRLIAGFLAGCAPQEVDAFLDLTVGGLAQHVQEDALSMVRALTAGADARRALPPRQLQSSLLLLAALLSRLGLRLRPNVPRLLRLLLAAAATANALLGQLQQLPGWHVRTLKKARGMAITCLCQLLDRFDAHPFSAGETDALFEACVWPSLPKLQQEATTAPTALLRMLLMWAAKPRYLPLLVKQPAALSAGVAALSPLAALLSLLEAPACQPAVTKAVVRAAELLLTAKPEKHEEGADVAPLNVNGVPDGQQTGRAAVAAHVAPLLQFLRARLETAGAARLSASELTVLASVCQLEGGAARAHAAALASLLLPVLSAPRPPPEQRQRQLLLTLSHLLSTADRPQKFVRPLSALCSLLPSRDAHLAVVGCLLRLGERTPAGALARHAQTVQELNAMSTGHVDEPDFERRLVVYGQINERLRLAQSLDDDYLRLVVHNCLWALEHESDMALRDSSTFCLQETARTVGRLFPAQRSACTAFLSSCLLPALRLRLRSQADELRHEAVAVLQAVVGACGDHLPRMQQLARLSDADPEQDFFENIRHIQIHRRTKALKRVVEGLTAGSLDLQPDVITNYVLPLANVYLFNDKYNKYQGLNEVSVRLVGVVAGRMSWHQYHAFLRHFLAVLPTSGRQKDAVRVLVAVLDAFQFDLSGVAADVTSSIVSAARTAPAQWKTQLQDGDGAPATPQNGAGEPAVADDGRPSDSSAAAEPEDATSAELPEDSAEPADAGAAAAGRLSELICRTLIRATLPGLHAGLVRRARGDDDAASGRGAVDADDERAQRLPLALAMVKLLQKLPRGILDANVAGVLVRVCELLRSRTPSVREAARETLCRCVRSLGGGYLPLAVAELRASAGRGFQLHVMVHTLHVLLKSVQDVARPGDVDGCVDDVVQVCHMELFEQQADEKEVGKITSKTAEAKGIKAYKTLHLTARFVTEGSVMPLIRPLQQWASEARTAKASGKVAECLRHACSGLAENASLSAQALLVLSHALVSRTLGVTGPAGAAGSKQRRQLPPWLQREDCRLVPPTPKRSGAPAKITSTVNAHLLIDAGLQLLSSVLRRDKQQLQQLTSMLDPLLPLLSPLLEHSDVKLVTACVRCWTLLLPLPLASLPSHLAAVSGALFSLLHQFAVPGLAPGDNFDLVAAAFKAVTVLVRDVRAHTLSEDQLRVLLTYAEQDLQDAGRQTTALALVRAVLARRLHAPELQKVVTVLRRLAVTAAGGQLRQQARAALLQYLLDYPLGQRLAKHVTFFLQQLGYEHESGRIAALEVCGDICRQFPQGRLSSLSPLLLLYLSPRLVADAAPACRRQVARTVTLLLSRVAADRRDELLQMALTWLRGDGAPADKTTEQRRMAAQLVGLFLSEGAGAVPDAHRDLVLPPICSLLDPDVSDLFQGAGDQAAEFAAERGSDQLLYQLLTSLLKLLTRWPDTMSAAAADSKHADMLTNTWGHVKQYLLHPHAWVRLAAGQLVGLLLSQAPPAAVAAALTSRRPLATSLPPYLANETARRVRGLALDLCVQLNSDLLSQNLADQCVKSLVWVAKVLIAAGAIDSVQPHSQDTAPVSPGKRLRRDSELSDRQEDVPHPTQQGKKRNKLVQNGRKRADSESSQKVRKRTDSESSTRGRKRTDSASSTKGRKRTESESSTKDRKRTESESSQLAESSEHGLSLRWLTRRLRREVNAEVVKNPKITIRRSSVFKWSAAVALALAPQALEQALPLLLPPLVREISDPTAPLQLKTLATEVTDLMKKQLGVEAFTAAYTRAQTALNQRKAERRVQRAQQLLTNPTKSARLKMQKHLKKSAAKKRRLLEDKKVGFKRRRTVT